MKNIKEHLKEKHGNHFQDCNFGKKEFNLKKRKLSPEEELTANAPTSGRRKSKSTTTTTTNSGSTTTTTTSGSGVEGPIMGAGYYVPDNGTKWWIGPNSIGCNVIQDDNAILITALGLK